MYFEIQISDRLLTVYKVWAVKTGQGSHINSDYNYVREQNVISAPTTFVTNMK